MLKYSVGVSIFQSLVLTGFRRKRFRVEGNYTAGAASKDKTIVASKMLAFMCRAAP